jgi:hypothetical protein
VTDVAAWLDTRRDEVLVLDAFVRRMKIELAANAGKGDRAGWMADSPRTLLAEIQHHYVKLHACVVELDRSMGGEVPRPLPWIDDDPHPCDLAERVAEFAADVANMAMMVADRCGALDPAA